MENGITRSGHARKCNSYFWTDPNQKKCVLIVEDSPDIQGLLVRLLMSEGYITECASNGREALDKLAAWSESPGVILLDLMMPDMDGYEFRQEQEKHAKTGGIPVVVMTADSDIQSKAMKLGARGYLKKPFLDVERILDTVGQFFPKSEK